MLKIDLLNKHVILLNVSLNISSQTMFKASLVKVEKEAVIKEERLQEKDFVIKTLKGSDGNSVALAKKINKLKKRDKLKVLAIFS